MYFNIQPLYFLMGNEELDNINEIKNKFYLHVNLIGIDLDQKLNKFIQSFQIKNIKEKAFMKKENDLRNLFDYWDWTYNFNLLFEIQCKIIFENINSIKNQKRKSNECLIVRVDNPNCDQVKNILKKINEIEDKDYMPLTLFLCDQKVIFSNEDYPNIDSRIILTEKFKFTGKIEKEPIYRTLMTFCSLYHELGDRFTVGKKDYRNDYCLIEKIFPKNLNIICLGRIRQGKSTCTNIILNEMRANESDSGTSQTKKMTYYQVKDYPVKVLDLPGFENLETIEKTISELKQLKNTLNKMKDKVHIILYIIEANSTQKFIKDEFLIFNELIDHEEAKVIYVFTKAPKTINKQKKILNKTEESINNIIDIGFKNYPNIDKNKIIKKMQISQDNSIFVNFIDEEDMPKFGVDKLFHTISSYFQSTKSFRDSLKKKDKNDIEKEAYELKEKAQEEILSHKIGGALIGAIPIVDMITQKFLIKKNAINKISQIFGIDLDELEKYIKNLKKEQSIDEKDICNAGKNVLSIAGDAAGAAAVVSGSGKAMTLVTQTILEETTYIKFFSWELFKNTTSTVIDTSTSVIRVGMDGAKIGMGIALGAVMSLAGIGLGAYFTTKELNEIIEKFYKAYLTYGYLLNNSYLKANEYLSKMEIIN